jgi:hypothetical protein
VSDLPVGHRPDGDDAPVQRHAAGASDAALAGDRDDLIARVYQLLDFQIELADDGEHIAPELPDTVMALVDGLDPQRCPARVGDLPDDVLGVGLGGRHVVATGDRLVDSANTSTFSRDIIA